MVLKEARQGKACAVASALSRFNSVWWIITDADATYPASDMFSLFQHMEKCRYDHGILDRLTPKNYVSSGIIKTFLHRLGNYFFTYLISRVSGVKYQDALSGGRIFSHPFIDTFVITSDGFELESEINFHAAEVCVNTCEYSCEYLSRGKENPSKLSTFKDGLKILRMILKLGLKRKPYIFFYIIGFFMNAIGIVLSLKLLFIYLRVGQVIYSSTAVLVALFLLGGIHFFLFGLSIKNNRMSEILNIRMRINATKRIWNEELDHRLSK